MLAINCVGRALVSMFFSSPMSSSCRYGRSTISPPFICATARRNCPLRTKRKRAKKRMKEQDLLQSDSEVFIVNRVQYIIVKEGDTFESLSEKYDNLSWELPKYNELSNTDNLEPGQVLYLQPKRNKADVRNKIHLVREGEDMYSISQKYGIKLEKLYALNGIKNGVNPEPGQKLSLRKRVKSSNSEKRVLSNIDLKGEEDKESMEFKFEDLEE